MYILYIDICDIHETENLNTWSKTLVNVYWPIVKKKQTFLVIFTHKYIGRTNI